MQEQIHGVATLLSLFLTSPTIAASLAVVVIWRKAARLAWLKSHKKALDWFTLGVLIGFLGNAIDNIYWGVAWSTDYLQVSSTKFWFRNGVFPNIFFRQLADLLSALCHIKAASSFLDKNFSKRLLILSGLVGLAHVAILISMKPF